MFDKSKDKGMDDDMDMLREISSIASAHGSRALSEMLGKRINLVMPNLKTVQYGKIKETGVLDKIVISVQARILNGISGNVILLYDEASAFELVHMCCPSDSTQSSTLTEMGFSALKEVGNVIMGSFAGALSIILKKPVVPSIPTLVNGPAKEIIETTAAGYGTKSLIILVETCFEEEEKKVKGSLCFVIPEEAFKEIQSACKRMLKEL